MTPEEQPHPWDRHRFVRELRDANGSRMIQTAPTNEGPWTMIYSEFQPARGWADYDTAFLKDLGIEPME